MSSRHNRLEEEAHALVERLGGRWNANGGMCRCPAHDDRTPSLSVRVGRSRLLLHCFAGCNASMILRALDAMRLMVPSAAAEADRSSERSDRSLGGAALRLWKESRRLAGSPAQAYLLERGLRSSSPELRFNPLTPRGPMPFTARDPALIAAVRDDSGLVAVHRSFIEPHGRCLAPLASPRCGLGRFGRGAVRLGGIGPRLGLAEGIETALSATALFDLPCWATLGVERFRSVSLPRGVERLLLFLDNDAGGRRAEALAREAFGGVCPIEAHYPPAPGQDWNDVLLGRSQGAGRTEGREREGG